MILSILTYIYIGVAVLIAVIIGAALIRVGGFQELADLSTKLAPEDVKYTSNEVQWHVVFMVFAWPLTALLIVLRLY